MTDITYKGANCLIIQTKATTIVTDPVTTGVKLPKEVAKARVVLATQPQFGGEPVGKEQLVLNSPGEYEVGDVSIVGHDAESQLDPSLKTTVFRLETPEARMAVIGHINPDKIDDTLIENLGVIDILFVPVGGAGYTVDAHGAAKLVRRVGPKVVIPVHYKEDGVAYEVPQNSVEDFIRELGIPVQEEVSYKLKQASQLPETLTLIRLTV